MENNKIIKYTTASLYVLLYIIVATISCICSVDFFNMTHGDMASVILSISFEIGSMGCLFGALTTLKNKNNNLIWILFIFLTLMQMANNTFYSYSHIDNFSGWVELFDLTELEIISQKRIIAIISGCVLPLVSLSFVHLLVDLFKNDTKTDTKTNVSQPKEMSDDDMKNELKKIISEKKKNKTLTGTIIDEDEVNNLPDDSNEFVGEILQDDPKHTSPFTDIKESMVDALNGLNNYCKNRNIQKQ